MLLLSWLAGVPLPVAVAVFDMGKRGHQEKPHCCFVPGSRDFLKFLIFEGLEGLMC